MTRIFAGTALVLGSSTNSHAMTNGLDETFGNNGFAAIESPTTDFFDFGIRGGSRALIVQDDGKIIVVGHAGSQAAIGRLLADGSWDQEFGNDGVFALPFTAASAPFGGEFHNVVLLSDHSIVAAGGAYASSGGVDFLTCTLVLKLTSTGALDESFPADHSGSFCFDFAPNETDPPLARHWEGFLAGPDDSLYLTTPYTNGLTGAVAHFDASGALVSDYGDEGIAGLPGVFAGHLQLNDANQIVVVGAVIDPYAIAVVRLGSTGEPDANFGTGGLLTFDAQPDGLVSPGFAMLDAQQRLVIADDDFGDGDLLTYRFARVSMDGALDAAFNGAAQQPGYPGFAALELGAPDYFNGLSFALPLPDGHILGIGDAGQAMDGDGTVNLALVRLAEDSAYDTAFGDAAHPGWGSLNIGGTATGTTRVVATGSDAAGRVLVAVIAGDGVGHGCSGLIRIIPDRLLDNGFDEAPAMPKCPH
jgi:uncharacterized delta-60 repeat protein